MVVLVIEEDGLLGIAPGGNVIEGVREFEAQRSCHVRYYTQPNVLLQDLTPCP